MSTTLICISDATETHPRRLAEHLHHEVHATVDMWCAAVDDRSILAFYGIHGRAMARRWVPGTVAARPTPRPETRRASRTSGHAAARRGLKGTRRLRCRWA